MILFLIFYFILFFMYTLSDIPLLKNWLNEAIHIKALQGRWCYSKCQLCKAISSAQIVCLSLCCPESQACLSICQHHSKWNNCHDHSVLNLSADICWESFLIDDVTLTEYNHQIVSQTYIQAVTHVHIAFEDIVKKAHTEVCQMCLLTVTKCCAKYIFYILLVEVFSHWPAFDNVSQLTTFIKSSFFKKPSKKQQYLKWLRLFA